jgi:hypothetical protein
MTSLSQRRIWHLAVLAALLAVVAACSSSAATSAPATNAAPGTAGPAVSQAAATSGAVTATQAAVRPTAGPVLASVSAALSGLTSYQFKLTVKGGSYATSVGAAGVVGTVVNSPSFAVQFTYSDLEIIEIQGKNWTKNGSSWDLSLYPNAPTTYDSYGPAVQLTHYFDQSFSAHYTSAGDETVNGVPTTRYTAAPQGLNFMLNNWGVKGQTSQAGDIWIAKSGGYPVRWKVTATGGVAGPGSGGFAGFEYLLDITKANDPGNVIHVPAS